MLLTENCSLHTVHYTLNNGHCYLNTASSFVSSLFLQKVPGPTENIVSCSQNLVCSALCPV